MPACQARERLLFRTLRGYAQHANFGAEHLLTRRAVTAAIAKAMTMLLVAGLNRA